MVQISNKRLTQAGAERARRRGDARRLEILRAAGRTFRRRGFAAAGMREIAAEADLSPGNLYHYFRGKDEILYFCQDQFLDRMLAELATARRQDGPVAPRLRRVLEAHILGILDEVEGTAAHLEIDALSAGRRDAIVGKRDRYEHGIQQLVASGVGRGEFRPCNPKLVTRAILGAMNWTARWFRPDGGDPAGAVADEMAGYLLAGLESGQAVPSGASR